MAVDDEEQVDEAKSAGQDLRMVPLAAACWAATWVGTGGGQTAIGWGGAAVAALVLVARLRRSWWSAAVALVLLVGLAVGAGQHYRLVTGPVAELAEAQAVANLDLVVRSDPQVHAARGPVPVFVTLRADLVRVDGRGAAWRVRSPVLLSVSGRQVSSWSAIVVGTRVTTAGRLQSADPGSDFAALIRIRAPITVTRPRRPLCGWSSASARGFGARYGDGPRSPARWCPLSCSGTRQVSPQRSPTTFR